MALTTISTSSAQNVVKTHKGKKKKQKPVGLCSTLKGT